MKSKIIIECHAEHYLEPISSFIFLVTNSQNELAFNCRSSAMVRTGFNENLKLNNGKMFNGQLMAIEKLLYQDSPLLLMLNLKREFRSIW